MSTQEHGHGNRLWPHKPPRDEDVPVVRKVPADSVPYGDSISRNGRTVWAAYSDNGVLIGAAPTADEARKMWRTFMYRQREAARAEREKGSSVKS